ncbi:MAG: hypothetical protein AAF206_27990 [Bacteroidota bacterium]
MQPLATFPTLSDDESDDCCFASLGICILGHETCQKAHFTDPAARIVGDSIDPADTGSPTLVDDNCDDALIPTFVDNGSFNACGGSITRTWSVVDDCGNSTSLDQVITIDPAPNPVITIPSLDLPQFAF